MVREREITEQLMDAIETSVLGCNWDGLRHGSTYIKGFDSSLGIYFDIRIRTYDPEKENATKRTT